VTEQTGDLCGNPQYKILNHDVSMSWRQNMICKNLSHHLPATFSVRSADGCVAHALNSLTTCDDETCHVDGSVLHVVMFKYL